MVPEGPAAPWNEVCPWGGVCQVRTWQPRPAPCLTQQQGRWGELWPHSLGTSLGMRLGQIQVRPEAHGCTELNKALGQAGKGCGELETSPVAASLGQVGC